MATNVKKQNIANKTTRTRKSTGPITEAGKTKASKNAVVHGATSTQLLNETEQNRYDELLKQLKEFYPNPNPLVQLQLERIAKLNIQLSRIQNTIDAQFLRSRALSRGYHDLARHLDMDRETKA